MNRDLELTVVGINYRVTPATIRELQELLPLQCELIREPDNYHDPNAVKVVLTDRRWRRGFHIGYLSRQLATEIGPRMDGGKFPYVTASLGRLGNQEGLLQVRMARKKMKTAGN
jgi:HIRAN domain